MKLDREVREYDRSQGWDFHDDIYEIPEYTKTIRKTYSFAIWKLKKEAWGLCVAIAGLFIRNNHDREAPDNRL